MKTEGMNCPECTMGHFYHIGHEVYSMSYIYRCTYCCFVIQEPKMISHGTSEFFKHGGMRLIKYEN